MPNRMSDAELLEQTAEWLSRLAETIERVTNRLADSIAEIKAEQADLRDEVNATNQALAGLSRVVASRTDHLV